MKKLKYTLIGLITIPFYYAFYPSIYHRRVSKNTIRRMPSNSVALTFDDGPDERYTYQLLEKLKKHHIKATFFVLANKAKENPNIIKAIKEDGHEIALHGYNHRCQWFMTKKKLGHDINESMKILNDLECNPRFLRPTWGLFNRYTKTTCEKYNLQTVFWTIHGFDWSKKATSRSIIKYMDQVKSGDIILLHDSNGAKEAPQQTIDGLDRIILNIKEKGLDFKTLSEVY